MPFSSCSAPPTTLTAPLLKLFREDTRRRDVATALLLYLVLCAVYLAVAGGDRLTQHSSYNHFALLADSWLHGRTDLGASPPPYSGRNDFALFEGRWFVTFPGFPAALLLPVVWFAGDVEQVRDAQFFIWLAGIGPALFFLVLERLRRLGYTDASYRFNVGMALLFALGSVYFFVSVLGTVWFAAHVVAVALAAGYLWASIEARHPILAGVCIGLALWTRPSVAYGAIFFLLEVFRRCRVGDAEPAQRKLCLLSTRWTQTLRPIALFALPVVVAGVGLMMLNQARFGNPFDFGYEYLQIAWQDRIEKWGLFHYHYLARNLGVMFTSLPYVGVANAPFQINGHGLALWVTTPLYVLLAWPRRVTRLHLALWITVGCIALPTLCYQNTGWIQFGYRFSTDYQAVLFTLLVLGGVRWRRVWWALGLLGVIVNTFGAVSFQHAEYRRFYYVDRTQRVIYQPD